MSTFSDSELRAYLDEAAPSDRMAAVEDALRDDDSLRERLASIVAERDAGLHSLGDVWRRRRLTCPTREQLGSSLLGVLPEGLADYVRFHVETVGCRLCNASLDDLREQHEQAGAGSDDTPRRRGKYFQSSVGRLAEDR